MKYRITLVTSLVHGIKFYLNLTYFYLASPKRHKQSLPLSFAYLTLSPDDVANATRNNLTYYLSPLLFVQLVLYYLVILVK